MPRAFVSVYLSTALPSGRVPKADLVIVRAPWFSWCLTRDLVAPTDGSTKAAARTSSAAHNTTRRCLEARRTFMIPPAIDLESSKGPRTASTQRAVARTTAGMLVDRCRHGRCARDQ